MRRLLACAAICVGSLLLLPSLHAQNLEAGLHAGFASIDDLTPLGREETGEFGIWVQLWPSDRLALSLEWAYLPRDDFTEMRGPFVVGETDRNRQYVDVTLQFHLARAGPASLFVEGGGGSFWNNRIVINPSGIPDFEEAGKESDRHGVWTVGGGFRWPLVPHLNWIGEVKFHNPGSEDRSAVRLITGLTISWR